LALFGLFRRDARSAELPAIEPGSERRDGVGAWSDGTALLGCACSPDPDSSRFADRPIEDQDAGFALAAVGRIDNRDELARELRRPSAAGHGAAGALLAAAYRRWGEHAPSRILGDWMFAAWHAGEHRLFLARDQLGASSLYYQLSADVFAFASSQRKLLALGAAKPELDELYLAQYLVSWPAYHGGSGGASQIKRLPPGHQLTITPQGLELRRYWRVEDVTELQLPSRHDYAHALRDRLDQAVGARLPSSGHVGITLSGGLDSGSVAVTAAAELRPEAKRLAGFTSVPMQDTTSHVPGRFANELPFAERTAAFAGNIDLFAVDASRHSPVSGIRQALRILGHPVHAASNLFWMLAVLQAARDQGCSVMLTGQLGNPVISWQGSVLSQSLAYQARTLGARGLAKARLKNAIPRAVLKSWAQLQLDPDWYRRSAIHPEFAQRLELAKARLRDPNEYVRALEQRLSWLDPSRRSLGAEWGALGADYDLQVWDPTSDARLVSFSLSVPDWVFIDQRTGMDRWLIREAMRGRLPDEVRLNRRRGKQAADLVPRLRASAEEVDDALDELAGGPAAAYVDVPYMRETWRLIQREDTRETLRNAGTVLMRGIMGGLYVHLLDRAPGRPVVAGLKFA
jgi:asparagine synthase (glutamine-hydrolysing)